MSQAGHGLGFSAKPANRLPVPRGIRRQNLDRDRAVQRPLHARIHRSHAACRDQMADLIMREHCPQFLRGRRQKGFWWQRGSGAGRSGHA